MNLFGYKTNSKPAITTPAITTLTDFETELESKNKNYLSSDKDKKQEIIVDCLNLLKKFLKTNSSNKIVQIKGNIINSNIDEEFIKYIDKIIKGVEIGENDVDFGNTTVKIFLCNNVSNCETEIETEISINQYGLINYNKNNIDGGKKKSTRKSSKKSYKKSVKKSVKKSKRTRKTRK